MGLLASYFRAKDLSKDNQTLRSRAWPYRNDGEMTNAGIKQSWAFL